MNYRRILLGALLAGAIITVSEFLLNGVVMVDPLQAQMQSIGLTYTSWAMPFYVVVCFVYGLFLAFGYAAVRPRFGRGARTAVTVAGGLWLVGYLIPTLGLAGMGVWGASLEIIGLIWGLLELLIAAGVAGYVYKEVEAPEAEAAPTVIA